MFLNKLNESKIPIIFWSLSLLYITILLIGPRIDKKDEKDFCVRNFYINKFFGHSMNCDSADWILNSNNPSRLYESESIRQSRPGLIFLTYNISKFINLFLKDDNYPKITTNITNGSKTIINEEFNPKVVYLSYFLVNIFILLCSIYLFFKLFEFSIFKKENYENWYIWLSSSLIINNTVNQFLFSPSTKFFNIFCAIFTIFISIKILKNEFTKYSFILVYSFLGFLMLFYASFFISFLIFTILFFVRPDSKSMSNLLLMILLLVIYFLPYSIWFWYIKSITNSFYISSLEDYDFIFWIYKYYSENGLTLTIFNISMSYVGFIKKFLIEHSLLLLFIPLVFFIRCSIKSDKKIYFSAIFFIFTYISFFVVLGHIPSDIVSVIIIPIAIILTHYLKSNFLQNNQNAKKIKIYFFSSLLIYYIWSATKFGPYS